eukprot:TRINITY_DN48313_c0_g1_i1.p1 TRINITY_DN48313_c0_g1~~TRINITY_DN48313_c0_g1_i1.p1  ORF type:complete len:276 (+),score=42.43 TRINITY_DN48313_c0_g1_i1:85-912(+)
MARMSAIVLLLLSGTGAQPSVEFSRSLRGSADNVLKRSKKDSFSFSECFAEGSAFDKPPLLNSSDFDSLLLPAPDLNGTIEDLAILKFSQESRSPETVISQWAFLSNNHIFAYNAAIGANLEKEAPTFSKCITTFYKESVKDVKNHFKNKIQRLRPFLSHPDLKPCIPEESGYSYPSGHATFYGLTAELLTAFYPDLEERLKQVGSAGVYARVIGGVHYPSDVEAGRQLGRSAAEQIMKTSLWNAFLSMPGEKVTEELARIQKLRPAAGLPVLTR